MIIQITKLTEATTRLCGGVQAKANLPETYNVVAQFLLEMHNNEMFNLENECQRDVAQHTQWRHSMANIKIYKRHYVFLR